jgi:hypothetical protein
MSVTIIPDIGHIVMGIIICAMAIRGWIVDLFNRKERDTLTKKLMAQAGSLHRYVAGEVDLKDADSDMSYEAAKEIVEEHEAEVLDSDLVRVD